MRTRILSIVSAVALLLALSGVAVAGRWERANVMSPDITAAGVVDGVRQLVAANGAGILRTPSGVTASLSMPTPEPGSYAYPGGPGTTGTTEVGPPEAYSLWVFIFFNPEACTGPCDGADLFASNDMANRVFAGAFNGGGHIVRGPMLNLAGHVDTGSPLFGGPNAESIQTALDAGFDLAGAEIHLAVAPHGALTPELLPASISTPVGTAPFWWVALFGPAA
jgi:hypothetical protein